MFRVDDQLENRHLVFIVAVEISCINKSSSLKAPKILVSLVVNTPEGKRHNNGMNNERLQCDSTQRGNFNKKCKM